MSDKSFLVDLTRCIGCRGCQIACKQWKKLPGEETKNTGSHQNPPDFSFITLRTVRYSEQVTDGKLRWFFTPDQCRHCIDPPCKAATNDPLSVFHDPETGAVVYNERTAKEPYQTMRAACPYNVPRQNAKTKVVAKCDMCNDRVHAGMLPACVKACPTGTMNFGDRDAMLKLAAERLAEAKKEFPRAQLVDAETVRVIFLAADDPKLYAKNLLADASSVPPRGPREYTRQELFAALAKPVRNILE
ncbi:MAG: formate dehydrogenase [Proteobacteria bacterium]|nr:formate dehydrogenase [Pseudomonadota bacterium]